jgi:hypothetical protein
MRWQVKFWIKAAIIIIIVLVAIIWSAVSIAVLLADKMV